MYNPSTILQNESRAAVKPELARPLILVADDDQDTRIMFGTMLQLAGYDVIEAEDGRKTVQMAESARPDVILMDGGLPLVDGFDATRQIREFSTVPIVFVSGHAEDRFVARAREAGCNEYLVKPVDLDQLEEITKKYASQSARPMGAADFTEVIMDKWPASDVGLFGLFELDATGTVLYHRIEAGEEPPKEPLNLTGRNFYDDIACFENTEELRRCVTDFRDSAKSADSFDFDCRFAGDGQQVRVLLARIREATNAANTKSILLHIRRAA